MNLAIDHLDILVTITSQKKSRFSPLFQLFLAVNEESIKKKTQHRHLQPVNADCLSLLVLELPKRRK